MQDIENKVIIYDDACPLCNAYTGCFLRLGWIGQRKGFTEMSPDILKGLDLDRARHEIPLHDRVTGETLYGLDALFFILSRRYPGLRGLFRQRWFRGMLKALYQVITYNRRVIAGSVAPKNGFDCAPDFHPFYRWVYVGLGLVLGVWGLSALPVGTPIQVLMSASLVGVLAAQLSLVSLLNQRLDFLGHWATLVLGSGVLVALLPAQAWATGGVIALELWMWAKHWQAIAGLRAEAR